MAVHASITNELGRIVGLVANRHPECSIQIDWREGTPEQEWIITASDGVTDHVYVADDEAGSWMPLNAEELARLDRGESILA